jgi:hypothetical protein
MSASSVTWRTMTPAEWDDSAAAIFSASPMRAVSRSSATKPAAANRWDQARGPVMAAGLPFDGFARSPEECPLPCDQRI